MEKNTSEIRISDLVEQTDKIELIDTLESVDSRKSIITSYLNALYDDLNLRSDAPEKGIPKVAIVEVIFFKTQI